MKAFISVIIPVKNESENIRELVLRLDSSLSAARLSYELIFVDGDSKDESLVILDKLRSSYPIEIIHQESIGKAMAIIEGVRVARSEYVVMIDADLQYPPEAIPEMWKIHETYPIVVARRSIHREKLLRKLASKAHSFMYCKILFGLSCDVQSGLKLFPKKLIDCVNLKDITPWTLDLALLVAGREKAMNIGEVQIVFENRQFGNSKVNVLRSFWEHSISAIRLKLKSF